ncbi:MAG: hypothetical protein ACQESP_08565 [Candidatus Muiribacteriota bacterium]
MEKTYYVSNMGEALTLIRKELGPEAFIIDQKMVDSSNDSNMLQYFSGKKLKVVAKAPDETNGETEKGKKDGNFFSSFNSDPIQQSKSVSGVMNNFQTQQEIELQNQLNDLKKIVSSLSGAVKPEKEDNEDNSLMVGREKYIKRLIENDVEEALAFKILHRFPDDGSEAHFEEVIKESIEKKLKLSNIFERKEDKIYFFIGHPGAGKTTSIIKYAVSMKLKNDAKILNVTVDNYKESGFQQLDSQCKMVDIKTIKANNPKQLVDILSENYDKYDYIFIDTPGVEDDCENITKLLPETISHKKLFVLNANGRYMEQVEKIENISNVGIDGMIFTKTDETLSLGNLLNILYKYQGIELAGFMNGQNIPSDMIVDNDKCVDYFLQKIS